MPVHKRRTTNRCTVAKTLNSFGFSYNEISIHFAVKTAISGTIENT